MPLVIDKTLHFLGDAGIPTALFVLGLSLGEEQPPLPSHSRFLVGWLVVLKSFVHPALACAIGHYVFDLGQPWLGAVTLIAAMPTALNNFVFAKRYGVFTVESGRIVFLTSVLSLFTLSALLGLLQKGN